MTEHEWPEVTDFTLDKSYDRSVLRSSRAKESEKLFTTPLDQGRCALVYPKDEFIGFLFPAKRFPYLGLWANEGGYHNQHQIALEPSTSQDGFESSGQGIDPRSRVRARPEGPENPYMFIV